MEIQDSTDNLKVFGSKYPKRLFNDDEVFLHPVTQNPRKILTDGALYYLLAKEGEGKDIAKASFHNARFKEKINLFKRPDVKRMHVMKGITYFSRHYGALNLGNNYPRYYR